MRTAPLLIFVAACDLSPAIPFRAECEPHPLAGHALSVDHSCAARRCAIGIEQRGCRLITTISECEDATLEGVIATDGSLEFQPSETLGRCTPAETPDGAELSIACASAQRDCTLDVYRADLEPLFRVETLDLVHAPFRAPDAAYLRLLQRFDHYEGSITGMVVLGDHVIVSAFDRNGGRIDCDAPSPPSYFFLINSTSFVVTSSVAAPHCLARIAPDPVRAGFFGVYGAQEPQLGRFTRDGVMYESVPIALPDRMPGRINGVLLSDDATDRVHVVISDPNSHSTAYVVVFDANDLTRTPTIAMRPMLAVITGGYQRSDELLLTVDGFRRADIFDASNGRGIDSLLPMSSRDVSRDLGFIAREPRSERTLIAAGGMRPGLWAFEQGAVAGVAIVHEFAACPWAMTPYPANPSLMLVGITKVEGLAASVALFDPLRVRFLNPATPIGEGYVGTLAAGENGQIFATLPWAGQIVRISEVPP